MERLTAGFITCTFSKVQWMSDAEGEEDAQKYQKFKKVDGATYQKVNAFLRKRTYVTAREWAIARLCADFKTTSGSEMTFIGEHLPELVPFMTDTYTPQAVNQARNAFKRKVKKAGATFFYGAMCGFFTAEELDDILFEASEVAKFLLEVEGTRLDIDEEISIEDRITHVMRNVAESAAKVLRAREAGEDQEPEVGKDQGSEAEGDQRRGDAVDRSPGGDSDQDQRGDPDQGQVKDPDNGMKGTMDQGLVLNRDRGNPGAGQDTDSGR
jgi:hypothetical protein